MSYDEMLLAGGGFVRALESGSGSSVMTRRSLLEQDDGEFTADLPALDMDKLADQIRGSSNLAAAELLNRALMDLARRSGMTLEAKLSELEAIAEKFRAAIADTRTTLDDESQRDSAVVAESCYPSTFGEFIGQLSGSGPRRPDRSRVGRSTLVESQHSSRYDDFVNSLL